MLNVIYGKNASGKTKLLRDMYEEHDERESLTNLCKCRFFRDIPYSVEKLEKINDVLDYQEIDIGESGNLVSNEFSQEFLDIVSLLIKDAKNIFLDEPDKYLGGIEREWLVYLIVILRNDIPELWIVTHDELLYGYKENDARYWNAVKENGEFKLEEV